MKIYRYVPDGRHFRSMTVSYKDRFWPEGISLGKRAEQEFPKGLTGSGWWLQGNHYRSRDSSTPLADFVATSMNILTTSERAASRIDDVGRVAVTTDGKPAYALQLPALQGALNLERSKASVSVDGLPLFWNRYEFRPEHVTADIFWLADAMPFSYIFMTEHFVERARDLTGLGYIELVWNGTDAIELSYAPVTHMRQQTGYRYQLEESFLLARAAMSGLMSEEVHPVLEEALALGGFPVTYPTSQAGS